MGYNKVLLKPGVDTQKTELLNEAAWSVSNLVRFFQGLLQKIGGWQRITSQTLTGVCRGILAWADLAGNVYVAAGTEQRLSVYNGGNLYDITPIRATHDVTPNYSTVNTSNVITVVDTAHLASASDWAEILNPIAVDGIVLQGLYQIQSVIDSNTYTITSSSNATSTINNGGASALFTTISSSSNVSVTLNNHNKNPGDVYTVYISTTVGGVTLFGDYLVQSVTSANVFVIMATGAATSSTSGSENAGNSRIEYLLQTGLVSASPALGYGEGGYGLGPYGIGSAGGAIAPLRQWSLAAWGQQLLASPTNLGLYFWDPTLGIFENPAALVSGSPAAMTGFFIAMPQQQVIAFGATDPNTGQRDPMLIRWCDVANYNDWIATALNQAGSFRLPRGSRIVGGIQGPQYGLLWTDLGLWAMQYIQPPLVYGFDEISQGCGLISMRCFSVLGNVIYWCSQNGFFMFSGGSVSPLPCAVWDIIFGNLTQSQQDKMLMAANSHFNEFFLFYPSLSGAGEVDSYVKYAKVGNVWDYGSLVRTAWVDQSVFGNPLGVDGNGLIQQHEQGNDADGQALISTATSGWFKLNDGTLYIFIERFISDFVLSAGASVNVTVYVADYPDDNPNVYGPFNVTQASEYIIIRSRGRFAKIQISSSGDIGSFWRLGEMLYIATPSGRR